MVEFFLHNTISHGYLNYRSETVAKQPKIIFAPFLDLKFVF